MLEENLGATVDAEQAPTEEVPAEVAPQAEAPVEVAQVAPGNCSGELVELPAPEGVTFKLYECQACHQVLHVGLEDLAENGLPVEHAPLVEVA